MVEWAVLDVGVEVPTQRRLDVAQAVEAKEVSNKLLLLGSVAEGIAR